MSTAKPRHETDREAYGIVFTESAGFKDTYGGSAGMVFLEAHRILPRALPSDTVLLFMHPIGGGAFLPFVTQMARAGAHVIYCNSRYRGNDSALIMEKAVLDMGQAIADAKSRFGYERVVLAGWSGGGALSLLYQQQARAPTITHTPAGDPLDLTAAGLEPAQAVMLVAAHPSRHRVLVDSLDPSIGEEADPDSREPALNLYGEQCAQPPYTQDFVASYRAAQLARNRRITAWVKGELERLRGAGRPHDERGFVVHGTMADPRWLDPAIDPNERPPGVCYLGDPRVVNDGPVGLARFCTLRSWLSQWSVEDANGDGIRTAADLDVPALVLCNGADEICTPGYAGEIYDAVGSAEKRFVTIEGANHYYFGPDQREHVRRSAAICRDWLAEHGLS